MYTYDGIGSYERTGYSCEVPTSHPCVRLAHLLYLLHLAVLPTAWPKAHARFRPTTQGSGKDLIQPVLDNQLKTISPLVVPEGVRAVVSMLETCVWLHALPATVLGALPLEAGLF